MVERYNRIARTPRAILIAFITLLVSSAICTAFYVYLLRVDIKNELRLEAKLVQKTAILEQLDLYRTNQALYTQQNGQLNAQIKATQQQIPTLPQVPVLLDAVTQKAKRIGLKLESFAVTSTVENAIFGELTVVVEVIGTFDDVLSLMYDVTSLPRLIQLGDIQITQLEEASLRAPRLSAKISFKTYYLSGGNTHDNPSQ